MKTRNYFRGLLKIQIRHAELVSASHETKHCIEIASVNPSLAMTLLKFLEPTFITTFILTLIISINSASFSQNFLKQTDSISNNTIDKYKIFCGLTSSSIPIEGSKPTVTGSIIQYRWLKSFDTLSGVWSLTPSSDTLPYFTPPNPGNYTDKNFYKRIVFNNGSHDTSNVCVVKVIPGSTNFSQNIINPPNIQNVHIGEIPAPFNGTQVIGGTTTDTIRYVWLKSQDPGFKTPFYALEGSFQSQNLSFTQGADTTFYYDRFAYILTIPDSELACISYSNPVKVYLLDSNVIYCSDTVFCVIDSTVITGNSEVNYSYKWETNNGTGWTPTGVTTVNYFTGTLTSTAQFRRIVIDTVNGFTLYSNVITIKINPNISNNWISNTSSTICAGQSGAVIGGLNPTGGDGNYQYSWLYSSDQINWTLYNGFSYIYGFTSHALYNTTSFKRIIQSGGCESTSNIVAVSPIIVDAVATSPILACGNTAFLTASSLLAGEDGLWTAPSQISITNINSPNTDAILTVALSATPYTNTVHWIVKNSGCSDTAKVTITFFHDISPANAGTDITLIGQDSVRLNAAPPQFGSGYWSVLSGGGTFVYSNDAHTYATDIPVGENIYRWTVSNVPCIPKYDDVIVTVTNIRIPEGFSPNGDIVNDYFQISGIEFYPKSELFVFNRWGIQVFYKNGYDNTWDGKSSGNKVLPEDTYFYVLKLDEKNSRKGYIILKR